MYQHEVWPEVVWSLMTLAQKMKRGNEKNGKRNKSGDWKSEILVL
ncbi:hypothetical protein SBF1_2330016 [Candidatus Desulfosporosinus infrequens]|uniref:Uncharacterized protein n=1 Tax=Candidatus Desulfosporosinus infrequens TaxID=2043169 RepID=A0A2U3KM93_9FIRM|nr:hypothetical protein SBF1_2330016 [Candidatus Desulfosporosinus infrequens]